jgi:hypothetical protein
LANKVINTFQNTSVFNGTGFDSYGIRLNNSTSINTASNVLSFMKAGIGAAGAASNSQFTCNELFRCYDGFYFDNAALSNQTLSGLGTGNNWDQGTGVSTCVLKDLDGTTNNTNPSSWYWKYYRPIANVFGSLSIPPISQPAAQQVDCGNGQGTGGPGGGLWSVSIQGRELLYGKIVRGENNYDTLQTEFRTRDSIYCFKQLASFDTLLNLGNYEDAIYQAYFDYCNNHNIGEFNDVDITLIDSLFSRFDEALLKNQNINPKTTAEENLKAVNEMHIRKLKYEADTLNVEGKLYEFDSLEIYTLEQIAYQHPARGGEAVIMARVLLWIEVIDGGWESYRRSQPYLKEDERFGFKLFPNPNPGVFELTYTLNEKDKAEFGIYNVAGMSVKKFALNNSDTRISINASDLSSGTYIYAIKVNGTLVKMDRLVIVK